MSFSDKTDDVAGQTKHAAKDAAGTVTSGGGVVAALSAVGFKSEYAYVGAFASIGLSFVSHFISRGSKGGDKAQADRWGIFVGHWAPTFMALGVALRLEEGR